jgi:hypothetical protein
MLIFAHCSSLLKLSSHDSMYASITLETVTLGTPNNVAGFAIDAPAERSPTVSLFQNRTRLSFSDSFTWTVNLHNHYDTDTSTTQYEQMEEHSVLPAEVLSM